MVQWRLAVLALVAVNVVAAWEKAEQAVQQAYHLVNDPHIFGVSHLSTQFPSNYSDPSLRGLIMSGPEYFAPCFSDEGNLLFVGLTVSKNWQNILNNKDHTATVSIASNPDPAVPDPRHLAPGSSNWNSNRPWWRKGMPSKGRATLLGHFEVIDQAKDKSQSDQLRNCYLSHHPDAQYWAPGAEHEPHVPFWAKFVIDKIYWVGGFGDEHFIGWLNVDLWKKEWQTQATSNKQQIRSSGLGSRAVAGSKDESLDLFPTGDSRLTLHFQT